MRRYKLKLSLCLCIIALLSVYTPISISSAENSPARKAYLTFDDGTSYITYQILDILKEYDVKATFFVLGANAEKRGIERIIAEGHGFGTHGYSHRYSIYDNADSLIADLTKANEVFKELVGVEPILFRPPYGEKRKLNESIRRTVALNDRNYNYIYWNGDSKDAVIPNITSKQIIDYSIYYINKTPKEPVLLYHDGIGKESTVEALPTIIEYLLDRGYEIVAMEDDIHIKGVTFRGIDKAFEQKIAKLESVRE